MSIVKSNSVANNVTCRTLGGTSELGDGFVVMLGSGGVSVSGGINNVSGCLGKLQAARMCSSLGENIRSAVGEVPNEKRQVIRRIGGAGDKVGRLFIPKVFFRSVKVACLNPMSKRSLGALAGALGRTGQMGRTILMRIIAGGKGNCLPTRAGPSGFRKAKPFSIAAKRAVKKSKGSSCASVFSGILTSVKGGSRGIMTVATTVTSKAKLSEFTGLFPREFFSMKVTRRRTVAFTTKLTTKKVGPIFTICSSFLRETFSRAVRSIYLRGLPIIVTISHTNLIKDSKRARRKIFSLSFLSLVPGLSVLSPGGH